MENLYEVLQVSEKASKEIIEKSYKTLAKKYHPDIAKNKSKAEEIMKKINNAYDILGDTEKRKKYDEELNIERSLKQNNMNATQTNVRTNVNTNASYRTYKSYNQNATNNMYENDYNNYYDYINYPNILKRFFNLGGESKKIAIIVIGMVLVILVKLVFDIWGILNGFIGSDKNANVNDKNNASSFVSETIKEEYVDNEELSTIFIDFMNDVQKFNIKELNGYLSETSQITDEQIATIEKDKRLIKRIVNNMNIDIYNPKSSNRGNGTITVQISRVNIDVVLLDVSRQIFVNYNTNYTKDMINSLTLDSFDKNINNITTIGKEIKFVKENNKWKINLTNESIYDIFGYNIKVGI